MRQLTVTISGSEAYVDTLERRLRAHYHNAQISLFDEDGISISHHIGLHMELGELDGADKATT